MDVVIEMNSEQSKVKSCANVAPMPLSEPFSEYGHGSVTRLREQKSTDVSSVDPAYSLNEMQSKLEIQREVNKELKRLLVASVGDEVQSRFDQLVSERAVLTHELDKSIQQLSEGSEELECMAIQCDVWRSKFIASRLMIDQLLNYKATVLVEHQKCQRVINKLLEEHNQLYQQLSATNSHLKQLTTMATSKKLSERPHVLVRPIQMPVENHSLLELADENSHLSSNLIKSPENISTNNNSVHHSLTVGEQLANQLLHVEEKNMTEQKQLMSSVISPSLSSTIRAFLSSREDHTDIKLKCSRCKGQIFVV